MDKELYPHPACMAPDGGDPCEGYHAALDRIAELEAEIADHYIRRLRLMKELDRMADKTPSMNLAIYLRRLANLAAPGQEAI